MQPPPAVPRTAVRASLPLAFAAGAAVGVLGGMIGLGGAEFRLPLLIMLFGFAALQAVILNEALSLVVVLTALPARMATVPLSALTPHWGWSSTCSWVAWPARRGPPGCARPPSTGSWRSCWCSSPPR